MYVCFNTFPLHLGPAAKYIELQTIFTLFLHLPSIRLLHPPYIPSFHHHRHHHSNQSIDPVRSANPPIFTLFLHRHLDQHSCYQSDHHKQQHDPRHQLLPLPADAIAPAVFFCDNHNIVAMKLIFEEKL